MKSETLHNPDEDGRLVSRCKRGDLDAFGQLVSKYQKRVFNMVYRMVGSYEESNDVAQEVFLAAYRGIGGFQEKARFSTWLFAIAMNLSRNRIRQLKSSQEKEQFSMDDPVLTENGLIQREFPSREPSILENLERKEVREMVKGCIDTLDPDFREVVVLRDIQGLTYNEIGEILKLPVGTVKSRLFRGRDSIRECLKSVMGDL